MPIDQAFLQTQIDAVKAQITAINAATLALSTTSIQEYRLDTGQTVEMVRRTDLSRLEQTIDNLYNRLATLCARLDGSGTTHVRPGW